MEIPWRLQVETVETLAAATPRKVPRMAVGTDQLRFGWLKRYP